MHRKIRKMRQKIKEKKGSIFIEYALGLLLLVTFVAFCVDAILIGHKHYYIGEEMGNISRTLSVQSGAEVVTPRGYPGGSNAYKTSGEIMQRLEKVASAAGFERDEWDVYVVEKNADGVVVKSGKLTPTTNFNVAYMNQISIQFSGVFDWAVLSSIVPFLGNDRYLEVERISIAEFFRQLNVS